MVRTEAPGSRRAADAFRTRQAEHNQCDTVGKALDETKPKVKRTEYIDVSRGNVPGAGLGGTFPKVAIWQAEERKKGGRTRLAAKISR